MLAVIFEFEPHAAKFPDYQELATALNSEVRKIDGFVSIERFESLTEPGKYLSLSFWRDEEAIAEWRQLAAHRAAQQAGRKHIFADYRLRVAELKRDYGMGERESAPADSKQHHG